MPTLLTLDEDVLNSRFADRQPSSEERIGQAVPYMYQEAEQGGKFYLIHDLRHLHGGFRSAPSKIVAYEFDTVEERHQYLNEQLALIGQVHVSDTLAKTHRTRSSLRERTIRRRWGKRRDDPGPDGDFWIPYPLKPKPPTRPAKDAKEPPQPEN
jgi:hypothetical protein